jgi:hypothetical protein
LNPTIGKWQSSESIEYCGHMSDVGRRAASARGFNSTCPSNDFPHDLLASPSIGLTNGSMPPLEAQNAEHEGRLISEVNSPSSAVRAAKLQPRRNASLIETPPPI